MTTETISGPDLLEGVHVRDLADGGMIAGRAGEDAVLLVRRGEEFFALDAFCTHYHAPLADGLLVGESLPVASRLFRPADRWRHRCAGDAPTARVADASHGRRRPRAS